MTDDAVQARLEEIERNVAEFHYASWADAAFICQQVRKLLARVAAKDGQLQKDAVRIAIAETQRDTARQQLAAAQERIAELEAAIGAVVDTLKVDAPYTRIATRLAALLAAPQR